MGKYRTSCSSYASSALHCGKSAKVVHWFSSSFGINKSLPHSSRIEPKNGNCEGKFRGNHPTINSFSVRQQRRHRLVSLYAVILASSFIFSIIFSPTTQAQPIFLDKSGGDPSIPDQNGSHINCTTPSANDFPPDLFSMEAKRNGAIIIHFIVSLYLFYALLLVCDEYFVPAVESICRELQIGSDVGGATFMAISTSAPELFTNVISTFVTNNGGDLGVGTIVGSAVFNILAVGAVCGIGVKYTVHKFAYNNNDDKVGVRLEWWPLTRDSIFYLASVGMLIGVLYNRKVHWTEALAMLALYAVYVLVLCYNTRIKAFVEVILWKTGVFKEQPRRISVVVGKLLDSEHKYNEKTPLLLSVSENRGRKSPDNNNMKQAQSFHTDMVLSKEYDVPVEGLDSVLIQNALSTGVSSSQPIDECADCCSKLSPFPEMETWSWKNWTIWVISWPIRFCLWLTVPNCKLAALRKWYFATLAMCVAWIGLLTYLISWMVTIIGDTLSIPDSVTGLTFLAAGTSVPEVISSLIVAKQGLGAMALANTISSNSFDILVCLGLPWLVKSAILQASFEDGGVNYIEIHSGGLEYSSVILISTVCIFYFGIALNRFVLDVRMGLICILMYVIFISFACMLEMNVFFPVNLPPCS